MARDQQRSLIMLPIAETAKPKPFTEPFEVLMKSVRSMTADLIAHLPNFVAALLAIVFTWLLVAAFKKMAPKLTSRFRWTASLRELFLTLGKATIWLLGLLVAAMIIFPGLTPSKALGAAGLASVAIGLAFKDIFQNFFAGILLMWKFPFDPGDYIECGEVKGRVIETELRLTTIRATSGELIVVPNAHLVGNPLEVLTDRDLRRMEITTGVAYGEDVPNAVSVIESALKECPRIDTSKSTDVLVSNFGSSSIDIDVLIWTKSLPLDMRKARAEIIIAIKAALDEAGIEIPFPYRTMTFAEPLQISQK